MASRFVKSDGTGTGAKGFIPGQEATANSAARNGSTKKGQDFGVRKTILHNNHMSEKESAGACLTYGEERDNYSKNFPDRAEWTNVSKPNLKPKELCRREDFEGTSFGQGKKTSTGKTSIWKCMQHDVGPPESAYVGEKPSSAAVRDRVTPPWVVNVKNQAGQPPPRSSVAGSDIAKPTAPESIIKPPSLPGSIVSKSELKKREVLNRLEFLTQELESTHKDRMALEAQLQVLGVNKAPRPAASVASVNSGVLKALRGPGSTVSAAVAPIAKQTVSFSGMES